MKRLRPAAVNAKDAARTESSARVAAISAYLCWVVVIANLGLGAGPLRSNYEMQTNDAWFLMAAIAVLAVAALIQRPLAQRMPWLGSCMLMLAAPGAPMLRLAIELRSNNAYLDAFADQLRQRSLPSGVQLVAFESEVGLLVGSGDHCDFRAMLQLKGSDELIRSLYAKEDFQGVHGGSMQSRIMPSNQPGATHNVVLLDTGYPALWDPRCWYGSGRILNVPVNARSLAEF